MKTMSVDTRPTPAGLGASPILTVDVTSHRRERTASSLFGVLDYQRKCWERQSSVTQVKSRGSMKSAWVCVVRTEVLVPFRLSRRPQLPVRVDEGRNAPLCVAVSSRMTVLRIISIQSTFTGEGVLVVLIARLGRDLAEA